MHDGERFGRNQRSHHMRRLCRVYVELLLGTGIRQGTESMPIRWRSLQWHWIGEKRYLRVWVSGKTGPRYLIARHFVIDSLERLIKWQALPYANLDAVIEAKLDRKVFVFPEGDAPHSLDGVFERLMVESNLLKDATGKNRTLYSLRHTYATFRLEEGVDIHTLAKQMGTSTLMIEKHYSKLTPMMAAAKLA
jgi:integrase